MKILPLKGYKSCVALNGFSALLLGVKMLPEYILTSYEVFCASFETKTEAEKEKIIRLAVSFVKLEKDEVEAIVSFVADENGIPYSAVNMKNLGLKELHEIITAVCMEIGRMGVTLVSEAEKKNCLSSQSTSEVSS